MPDATVIQQSAVEGHDEPDLQSCFL